MKYHYRHKHTLNGLLKFEQVKILKRLERDNVAYSGHSGAIRSLSILCKEPRIRGYILFSWNKLWKRSVITLSPDLLIKEPDKGFHTGIDFVVKEEQDKQQKLTNS